MSRFRILSYTALAFPVLVFVLPHAAFSAGIGTIVPQSGTCLCPGSAPDWGCLLQVLQNVINAAVYMGVTLCVVWIAIAGFTLMVSGDNPEARSLGKTRVLNAVIGIAIILCSWLVVDFVMKVVYEPSKAFDGGIFGPWNNILAPSGDDYCIRVTTPQPIFTGTIGVPRGGTPTSVGEAGPLCPAGSECSVEKLMAAGLTQPQARAMSCIAMTESSGIPSRVNSDSKACGLFQITNETSKGNWRNPRYHSGSCSVNTSCKNARCNLQTAVIMFNESGYQPWTCPGCNNKAAACVAKYDPGH